MYYLFADPNNRIDVGCKVIAFDPDSGRRMFEGIMEAWGPDGGVTIRLKGHIKRFHSKYTFLKLKCVDKKYAYVDEQCKVHFGNYPFKIWDIFERMWVEK